ncbi:ROK family transcriptional regulator [Microvirga yunnanensis]|uniref:ROK family transcriptional regulator n=1 Tax=Microvirga yunnanensis TaxID=2953740 RepID=UPI0021C5B97F|nr:ROK family transcriptional regulator [Microvirga sp. HBU65207]
MTHVGNNHAVSARRNRRLAFELIWRDGPISRTDLVARTGLRAQTISNIVRELQDRDLILESGRSEGGRGAPQTYLKINPAAGSSVGLHLDRDRLSCVVYDLAGQPLAFREDVIGWTDPGAAVATMEAAVRLAVGQCGAADLWGVGIAMPTLQDAEFDEYVGSPGWQAWSGFPIADRLQALTGLPTVVENDATAAGLGELITGAGRGLSNFVYIFVGNGLGAGIIADGLPFQGAWNNAGEIGLLSWPENLDEHPSGKTPFSLDELADMLECSVTALADPAYLADLYEKRNASLMRWLELNGRRLRLLASIIENLLDPQTIIVGGLLPSSVCSSLVDRAYPLQASPAARRDRKMPRLQVGSLDRKAAAIGAAMLPFIVNGSPEFRRLSLGRGRGRPIDAESLFDHVTGSGGGKPLDEAPSGRPAHAPAAP